MDIDNEGLVAEFREKSKMDAQWVNGGFFVLKSEVFKYLEKDMNNIMWEDAPLNTITKDKQLMAYKHTGFWKCMDALRDKIELNELWEGGKAPWKIWK